MTSTSLDHDTIVPSLATLGTPLEAQPVMLVSFDVASSEGQFVLTWVTVILTSAMYLLLTIFGCHNFFKYIVKQQNQLKLLYLLVIVAAAGRFGRYVAMVVRLI